MEHMIRIGEVDLCAESFGDPADEAVLLVAGTSCSMDWWPPALCEAVADLACFVIRFDQRDTGKASFDPPGRPSYALPDLAADAVAVLDHFSIPAAHWVGFSQGGWLSQLTALDHPDRVRSLMLFSTRPTGHGPADADLPEVSSALLAEWSEPTEEPDWEDRDSVVRFLVAGERSLAGATFDDAHARSIAESCVRRARQVRSAVTNHPIADQGSRWRERLAEIAVPCLIVHGSDDPLFPIGNAEALAREVAGSRLVTLRGVGHELPPRSWRQALDAIDEHVRGTA